MDGAKSLISDQVIACVRNDRAPTVREVEDVAARIWAESAANRPAFLWRELPPASMERVIALRAAVLALNGEGDRALLTRSDDGL